MSRPADKPWRPATTVTPFTEELDKIFGGLTAAMAERHVRAARRRAIRLNLLTAAELAALEAAGIDTSGWDDGGPLDE